MLFRAFEKTALGALVALSLLGASQRAHAQDAAAKATAVQLFDEGEKLIQEGRIAEACVKYRESHRLDPQLGALLHLADCYERNGQLASAWGHFREAEELARKRSDERASLAGERAQKLEPRLNRLTVIVPEAARISGLEISIAGLNFAPALWGTPAPIDSGVHRVEARAPGHQTWTGSVEITGEGTSVSTQIPQLVAEPTLATSPGAAPATSNVEHGDNAATLRTVGWVAAGVGAVGLGLGALFLVQRDSKLDDRDAICGTNYQCTSQSQANEIHELTDQARTADTIGKVSLVAGGVLLVGGVGTAIFAPKFFQRSERKPGAWLSPSVAPSLMMLTGGARF